MDTWNTDRIYNWFGLALNKDFSDRKFYFDPSDNTFFDLLHKGDRYSIEDRKKMCTEDQLLLLSKIDKIKNNNTSLIEIKKSNKPLNHLFDQTTSYENYMKREEEWNFVHNEIRIFLNQHTIPIEKSRLIE